MSNSVSRSGSPLVFFALVFILSTPFWMIGAIADDQIMPGLPISALIIISPLFAAVILRWREAGPSGVAALLARAVDWRRVSSWAWFVPALLLMPALSVIAFFISELTGVPLPVPQFTLADVALLCALFFVAALMEELGWMGYALDPLQARWGALAAALIIGVVWAVYHFVPLLQVGRDWEWIAWWTLGTIAVRVFMVALYNAAGGSVFIVTVFHMSQNVSWQLYPVQGSYYDPRTFGVLFLVAALVAVLSVTKHKSGDPRQC